MERRKFRIISLITDIVILTVSFIFVAWTKPASLNSYLPSHSLFFGTLVVIWLIVSIANGKLHRGMVINYSSLFWRVVSSNVIALAITALLMYIFRDYEYSRTVVLGTALVATFLELLLGSLYLSYKKATVQDLDEFEKYRKIKRPSEQELVGEVNGRNHNPVSREEINPKIVNAIERECGEEMAEAIIRITGSRISRKTAVLSTTTAFNIASLPEESYNYIINLHKLNDIRNPDLFIDEVNRKLDQDGYFLCCVETKDQRKARILKKFPPVLNYIYYSMDFLIKRVLPKFRVSRPLYFFLTRGENAVISRAEALGRLCRGGFRIIQESFIGNKLCIEAVKMTAPLPLRENVHGLLIALPRVGKNGRIIKVYKLRTMHPYSEYIQDYIYQLHDLQEGGKFRNDFRITSWGAVCRKIWIDELPMLINLMKGEMKLVGVRPLSQHYFELYGEELRERRKRYKPGLIPPFYADMPTDLDGIQSSELSYLDHYDKHPVMTDLKYLFRSVKNILFRQARSN